VRRKPIEALVRRVDGIKQVFKKKGERRPIKT